MKKNKTSLIVDNKGSGIRVVQVSFKIIVIFILFIIVSNLATNYINLTFSQGELILLTKKTLVKDLRDVYTYTDNQFEIYQYNEQLEESISAIEAKGASLLPGKKSRFLGVKEDGSILFQASSEAALSTFPDPDELKKIIANKEAGDEEGPITFDVNRENFFGFYKYCERWDAFIILAEEYNEFYAKSWRIFRNIMVIILIITILSAIVGVYIVKKMLSYITIITKSIMDMVQQQQLGIIDLKGAPNDEITYLGMAFNSLSSSINTLLNIFKKFVNKDIAAKAYKEKQIRLEGSERELTVLFTDIKSFTYITETLGSDIIKLLNLHYNNAIGEIMQHDGVIGSIIGDALMAVFGAIEDSAINKSYASVKTAYRLQHVTEILREDMKRKKEEVEAQHGRLNAKEMKIYKAVLLDIGVGIDGGNVFYGNIGSYDRMTNTVIGDNVNAASRMEGLTRIYNVPVICTQFVMKDIEKNVPDHDIVFQELDTVQVKGKTIGQKIYWPITQDYLNGKTKMVTELAVFTEALHLYYDGSWNKANALFKKCSLAPAKEFAMRTESMRAPENWRGIWEMKTK